MTMQEQLRALVERHHANLAEQVAIVARLLGQDDEGSDVGVARVIEAQGLTHQMKGTAGSMGFVHVAAAAAKLDEHLKDLKRCPDPVTAAQRKESLELLCELQRIAASTTPEMSTLYDADLSKLARQ